MERIRDNCPYLTYARVPGMRSSGLPSLLTALKDNTNLQILQLVGDKLSDSERAQLARVSERKGIELSLLSGFRTFVHKGVLLHIPR